MLRSPSGTHETKAAHATMVMRLAQEIPAFQHATESIDYAASAVLALSHDLLRYLDILREGPTTARELAVRLPARAGPREQEGSLNDLARAGYVRLLRDPASPDNPRIEITSHAREWMASLWGPVRDAGVRLLAGYSVAELATLVRFFEQARHIQVAQAERLLALAEEPPTGSTGLRRPNRLRGGLSPAALRRVQVFVHAHLDSKIHLRDLAGRAGLSEFHFARAFKVTTEKTPRAFIEEARVDKAEQLIRQTTRSLAEIALACGFSTQSHLTTAFRKARGVTPARYRRDL